MKTNLLIAAIFLAGGLKAQDTVKVNVMGKNMVTVVENGSKTKVNIGKSTIDVEDNAKDTVKIRVGRKTLVVADGHHGSSIKYNKLDDKEFKNWTGHEPKFKGHWSVFEMGINSFTGVVYPEYQIPNYMDLNHSKSLEVNINPLRFSFGLQKHRNHIGLVSGIGFNFNNYRFSNNFTIRNNGGYIEPVMLVKDHLQKTKLATGYLTVPLLIEFQMPESSGLWVSAGVIGGLKIGSHTKVKIADVKAKDHDDFNINPFRGGATVRVGYKGFGLFATKYYTPFFREGRGPEMYPFAIGLSMVNW